MVLGNRVGDPAVRQFHHPGTGIAVTVRRTVDLHRVEGVAAVCAEMGIEPMVAAGPGALRPLPVGVREVLGPAAVGTVRQRQVDRLAGGPALPGQSQWVPAEAELAEHHRAVRELRDTRALHPVPVEIGDERRVAPGGAAIRRAHQQVAKQRVARRVLVRVPAPRVAKHREPFAVVQHGDRRMRIVGEIVLVNDDGPANGMRHAQLLKRKGRRDIASHLPSILETIRRQVPSDPSPPSAPGRATSCGRPGCGCGTTPRRGCSSPRATRTCARTGTRRVSRPRRPAAAGWPR